MDRKATAIWKGGLTDGSGTLNTQSGALNELPYNFKARFEDEKGTSGANPEELLAAAHAGCFAMQLSHFLAENGTPAQKLEATAAITVNPASGGGFEITKSAITLVGTVPDINQDDFRKLAQQAKEGCPLSKALGMIEIILDARLA
ncbi:OsmC family peroxiredoxin [Phyllobacterium salinisoli]|uniref:OsmC family peroxiredoxin n=1 Tax=Phyllobacterium salinisoli TaxID=1899321 RepID=A0A368JWY1_9HYPH|nr:OsmC family protein [Phyllobacterium salinisoli]RCS21384.1 OsmC family peroxiredoxin [Phyllobacterium salinisoli]